MTVIIEEINDKMWDQCLTSFFYKSVFHEAWWGRTIEKFFPYIFKPYIAQFLDGIKALIPCYSFKDESSYKIGLVGYGGPLYIGSNFSADEELKRNLELLELLDQKLGKKCKGFISYPDPKWSSIMPSFQSYLSETHILDLEMEGFPIGETELFEQVLSGNVRTSIRKALKSGIHLKSIDENSVLEAYQLTVDTQKYVGASYTTPMEFYRSLALENSDHSCGYAAFRDGNMLSAGICLFSNEESVHYLHGWNREASIYCSNQLLIWHMIQDSLLRGCKRFNMGESSSTSLKTAKKRWNAVEIPLIRYQIKT